MSLATRRAIYGVMSADTTLTNLLGTAAVGYTKGIYYAIAPEKAAFPYVIFQKQAGTPTYTFRQGKSALDSDVWMVKGVDRNTTADRADAIATRLTDLLTDGTLSVSGATQLYLRRMSDLEYPEVTDGQTYFHSGALFRLVTEPQ